MFPQGLEHEAVECAETGRPRDGLSTARRVTRAVAGIAGHAPENWPSHSSFSTRRRRRRLKRYVRRSVDRHDRRLRDQGRGQHDRRLCESLLFEVDRSGLRRRLRRTAKGRVARTNVGERVVHDAVRSHARHEGRDAQDRDRHGRPERELRELPSPSLLAGTVLSRTSRHVRRRQQPGVRAPHLHLFPLLLRRRRRRRDRVLRLAAKPPRQAGHAQN
mmetsp:Transcript_15035/g.45500  ORF Transcript_15035/g.45500 Transcript_15035/m.45500 type:complete len:217 (+) Transcript_15035:699-1349(+)